MEESNSNYQEKTGDYMDAYTDVVQNGGQLYPGNGKDSANVVVRGKQVFVYWKSKSVRHREVVDICNFLGIDSHAMTGGRVARKLLNDILELPYKRTFWNKKYRSLAVSGKHWHYYHVVPNEVFYGAEFDLKSAYFASLIQCKTLLYAEGKGYLEDNGTLEAIRELVPYMPKWFRLQLLGCISSWNFRFMTRDKSKPDSSELVQKRICKITFNAAFNCVHRAILRNYKIMQKIHEIGGEHIKRMHTDSFFLSWECPVTTETLLFDYLKEKHCEVSVKASGKAFFFDLNTGFIGKKFVGSKLDVIELMRGSDIKMGKSDTPAKVLDRFGNWIEAESSEKFEESRKQSSEQEGRQLIIFDT